MTVEENIPRTFPCVVLTLIQSLSTILQNLVL